MGSVHPLHQRLGLAPGCQVEEVGLRHPALPADGLEDLLQTLFIPVRQDHLSPKGRQGLRGGPPDSGGRPHHQSHLPS